jgi:NitT/TauT family transport system substrate-binding protein
MASLAACHETSTNGDGYSVRAIRINDTGAFASVVQRIIMLKDMLEPYLPDDVSVEWTSISSGADQRDAIMAGQLDITAMSIIQFLSSIENDLPLALLSSSAAQNVFLYSNNEQIQRFEDITTSTRIAITGRATNMELAFFLRSAEAFGDPLIFSNNLIVMPNTEMLALLSTSREIDLAVIVLPNNIVADEIESLTMIEDLTPIIIENSLASLFVTHNNFLQNNPVLVEAFRRASEDAVRFINESPAEAAALVADDYGIAATHLVDAFQRYPVQLEVRAEGFNNTADLLFEMGILSRPAKQFSELPNYSDIPKE